MTRKRLYGKKKTSELTKSQRWALQSPVQAFGPDFEFETEAEYRQAWADHRAELLASLRAGMRPGAYWKYDAPEISAQRLLDESDYQLLYRFSMLSHNEIAELSERKGLYPPRPATGRDLREILEVGNIE